MWWWILQAEWTSNSLQIETRNLRGLVMQCSPRGRKRTTPIRGLAGYTLLEVLFAIFIILVVFVGLANVMTMLVWSTAMSNSVDTATDLAQDKMEELKTAWPTSPTLADANTGNDTDLESTSNFDYHQVNIDPLGRPGGIFTRTWNIADNKPTAGIKTVVVIVTWNDKLGSHKVSLWTIL